MANFNRRGPRALSEVLGELFTVRGYGRLQASGELEQAWNCAVGEPYCHQTRVGELRRGILSITVAHPTLLEELAAFRKTEILQALRASTVGATIEDIRFRIGPISQGRAEAGKTCPRATEQLEKRHKLNRSTKRRTTGQHTRPGEQNRSQDGDEKSKPGSC